MNIELVALSSLRPAAYNPRATDRVRLEIIKLSLRKLGFLIPMFATRDGELLSGHQRQIACQELGITHVPVVYIPELTDAKRRSLNILFNRATNDMAHDTTSESLTSELGRRNIEALAAVLPDRERDPKIFSRCLNPAIVETRHLVSVNQGMWSDYAVRAARALGGAGISMPIVCTPDDTVINGIGRLQHWGEEKHVHVPVVYISYPEAEFADAVLNLLSMDFTLENQYADVLRYNSFRRHEGKRPRLGMGMLWAMLPDKYRPGDFDIHNKAHRDQWVNFYGNTILDFGAGHATEVDYLRENGVIADAFEPYRLSGVDTIDKELSIEMTREFLKRVAAGRQWTSIFLSAIFNSVPFHGDRLHIAQLLAALCGPRTKLYAYSASTRSSTYRQAKGKVGYDKTLSRPNFQLEYEPGVTLGELSGLPKMQKYFTCEEFGALFEPFFNEVKTRHEDRNTSVTALCWRPRPISADRLKAALEFEFDLPYPDGTRMGLVDEALRAFQLRLNLW